MDYAPPTPKSVRFHVEDDKLDEDEDDMSDDPCIPRSPPPPSTPSPTRSGSTVSSNGVLTPPSPGFTLLMESKGASPTPESSGIPKLHPALCPSTSALTWDIAEDPVDLPALAMDGDDPAASLHSRYPLARLVLTNETLPEWPLYIAAPPGGKYLTVTQVLETLRQHLLKFVSGDHVQSQTSEKQQAIYKAYKLRLKCWPQSEKGIVRLDYLSGRTFQGLCVIGPQESDMEWEVRFDVT